MLPLLKSAQGVLALITFIESWNGAIDLLIVMRSPERQVLPVARRSLHSPMGTEWGALMAGPAIASLPLLVLCTPAWRQLVARLTSGEVE